MACACGMDEPYDSFSLHALSNIPLIGFVSQLTAAYNFVSVAVAEDVMKRDRFNIPSWATDSLDSAIYGGSIMGMCLMGFVGDRVGRSWGMIVTVSITMLGAVASGLSYGSDNYQILWITGCRFILGFGIGGVFPLGSASSAESESLTSLKAKRVSVGWSYVGQGPGYMLPYLMLMLMWLGNVDKVIIWRTVLIAGAIPVFIIFRNVLRQRDSMAFTKRRSQLGDESAVDNHFNKLFWTSTYMMKLAGTGGTWFLYDFVSFGVKMFAPQLVEEIFAGADDDAAESIVAICWQNMLLNFIGIPGLLLTMYLVSNNTPKSLLIWSFLGQSGCFVILGLKELYGLGNARSSFLVLAILYFFQNFGCGLCNYVIAAETYPVEVRSSFAGISAGIGKVGAIFGVIFFQMLIDDWGYGYMFLFCALVTLVGYWFTVLFVESTSEIGNDAILLLESDPTKQSVGEEEPLVTSQAI